MTKIIHAILIILISFLISPLFSQTTSIDQWKTKDITELDRVTRRMSYDNYLKIKNLKTSIINYEGQAKFDSIVNTYSEASALYFSREIRKAAKLMAKNEKDIYETGMRLARRYKKDAAQLISEMTEKIIKPKINQDTKGDLIDTSLRLVLNRTSSAMQKASDQYSWKRPLQAIYYYKIAKKVTFRFFQEMRLEIPKKYDRDRVDSRDQLYNPNEPQTSKKVN